MTISVARRCEGALEYDGSDEHRLDRSRAVRHRSGVLHLHFCGPLGGVGGTIEVGEDSGEVEPAEGGDELGCWVLGYLWVDAL